MLRLIYTLINYLALPFWVLRLLFLSLRNSDRRKRIGERFGYGMPAPLQTDKVIWIHAVSVGEVAAAEPLVKALLADSPRLGIVITCMTPTGSARAMQLLSDRVSHSYLPYDIPIFIRRFIRQQRPDLLILMETELWPNLLFTSAEQNLPIMLANGRLSARSAARYGRAKGFSGRMLRCLSAIAAQSDADAQRFLELGANANAVTVTGSLKFHIAPANSEQATDEIFGSIKNATRPVLIAASTREGEEEKVLDAFSIMLKQRADLLLLLVPRHAERFEQVGKLCKAREFEWQRRSQNQVLQEETQIVLGNSMYELVHYYDCADIAFVGGSLVDTGCQNVLEPAALGLPVITGPSQFNFKVICEQLEEAGALLKVADVQGFAKTVLELLPDDKRRQAMGESGKALIASNQQALPNHQTLVRSLLSVSSAISSSTAQTD